MCFFLVSFSNLSNVDPNNRNSRKYKRKITYLYSLWWFICTMIDVWQKWYWKKGSIFWVLPALIIISSHYYWTSRYVVRGCKQFFLHDFEVLIIGWGLINILIHFILDREFSKILKPKSLFIWQIQFHTYNVRQALK